MNGPSVAALLVAGGAGLVLQNTLMLQIRAVSGSFWIALWLNSGVGLVFLTWLVWAREGQQPLSILWAQPSWWYVLPGLLGTLFVFASLQGFAHVGAAITVTSLVASQLVAGLVFDAWNGDSLSLRNFVGAGLLIAGAALVAQDG
ncbi:MAG: DMT family transporter [Pseudomonadota bacterium]